MIAINMNGEECDVLFHDCPCDMSVLGSRRCGGAVIFAGSYDNDGDLIQEGYLCSVHYDTIRTTVDHVIYTPYIEAEENYNAVVADIVGVPDMSLPCPQCGGGVYARIRRRICRQPYHCLRFCNYLCKQAHMASNSEECD